MLEEEFERHWADFDGNLRDIMDTVIKELKSEGDGMKLRHEQGKDFLQPKCLLMSLFTLIVAGIKWKKSEQAQIPHAAPLRPIIWQCYK